MNRFVVVIMTLLIVSITACTKDDKDSAVSLQQKSRDVSVSHAVEREDETGDMSPSSVSDVAIRSRLTDEIMRSTVATARTARVARPLIDGMVDGILSLDNVEERMSRMRALSKIVAQRPIDKSTPSNRSFSHEVRFLMGLEVFDGFVKLDSMDVAWSELLSLLENYQTALVEAKAELNEIQRSSSGHVSGEKLVELRNAQVYYRSVNSGYEAAKEFLNKFVLPHVTEKYPMPDDVAKKMAGILE